MLFSSSIRDRQQQQQQQEPVVVPEAVDPTNTMANIPKGTTATSNSKSNCDKGGLLYINVLVHEHGASEAVKAKVVETLSNTKFVPASLARCAGQFCKDHDNYFVSSEKIAKKISKELCTKIPAKMEKKGLVVELEETFREGPYAVLEMHVVKVDTSAWAGTSGSGSGGGGDLSALWSFLDFFGAGNQQYFEEEYLPQLVRKFLVKSMKEFLEDGLASERIEASTQVIKEKHQARYFFEQLRKVRAKEKESKNNKDNNTKDANKDPKKKKKKKDPFTKLMHSSGSGNKKKREKKKQLKQNKQISFTVHDSDEESLVSYEESLAGQSKQDSTTAGGPKLSKRMSRPIKRIGKRVSRSLSPKRRGSRDSNRSSPGRSVASSCNDDDTDNMDDGSYIGLPSKPTNKGGRMPRSVSDGYHHYGGDDNSTIGSVSTSGEFTDMQSIREALALESARKEEEKALPTKNKKKKRAGKLIGKKITFSKHLSFDDEPDNDDDDISLSGDASVGGISMDDANSVQSIRSSLSSSMRPNKKKKNPVKKLMGKKIRFSKHLSFGDEPDEDDISLTGMDIDMDLASVQSAL